MEICIENTCKNCNKPIGLYEKYCDEECHEIHYRWNYLKKENIEKLINSK